MVIVLAMKFLHEICAAHHHEKEKAKLQKSNKVIREGGCACVYSSIYPTGFILIHT